MPDGKRPATLEQYIEYWIRTRKLTGERADEFRHDAYQKYQNYLARLEEYKQIKEKEKRDREIAREQEKLRKLNIKAEEKTLKARIKIEEQLKKKAEKDLKAKEKRERQEFEKQFQKSVKETLRIERKRKKAEEKARQKLEKLAEEAAVKVQREEEIKIELKLPTEVSEQEKALRVEEIIKEEEAAGRIRQQIREAKKLEKAQRELELAQSREVERQVPAEEKKEKKAKKEKVDLTKSELQLLFTEAEGRREELRLTGVSKEQAAVTELDERIERAAKRLATRFDKQEGLLRWLETPLRILSKLPDALITDYKELFLGEREAPLVVNFPKWEDVFKYKPEPRVSVEQQKEMTRWRKDAKAAGFPLLGFNLYELHRAERVVGKIPISDEQIKAQATRRRRIMNMISSPTPKTLQNIASTLQYLDDINDAAVTVAYVYRVSTFLLSKVAYQTSKKFLPGLGYILLAKDLFDVYKWIGNLNLLRSFGKRSTWDMIKNIPMLQRLVFRKGSKLASILPTFAEAIQIAQTTQMLTGYGLCLGPIMGHAYDSIFGTLRGAEFRGINKHFDPKRMMKELKKNKVPVDKSPNLTPMSIECIRILNAAPNVLYYLSEFDFEDVMQIMTSIKFAYHYLEEKQDLRDWDVWAKDGLDEPEKAVIISDDVRNDIIELDLGDPGAEGVFPYLESAKEMSPRMKASLSHSQIDFQFRETLKKNPGSPLLPLYLEAISDIAESFLNATEGKDFKTIKKMAVDAKSYYLLQEYGLAKKLGTPDELHMQLAEMVALEMIRTQRSSLSYQEINAMVDILKRFK